MFRWIEAMEGLPTLLVPGLVHIVDSTDHKGQSALSMLSFSFSLQHEEAHTFHFILSSYM